MESARGKQPRGDERCRDTRRDAIIVDDDKDIAKEITAALETEEEEENKRNGGRSKGKNRLRRSQVQEGVRIR